MKNKNIILPILVLLGVCAFVLISFFSSYFSQNQVSSKTEITKTSFKSNTNISNVTSENDFKCDFNDFPKNNDEIRLMIEDKPKTLINLAYYAKNNFIDTKKIDYDILIKYIAVDKNYPKTEESKYLQAFVYNKYLYQVSIDQITKMDFKEFVQRKLCSEISYFNYSEANGLGANFDSNSTKMKELYNHFGAESNILIGKGILAEEHFDGLSLKTNIKMFEQIKKLALDEQVLNYTK
jgi:hypothetical protein